MGSNKRKICLAVQRYGLEVNGGAELLARQIAEKLTVYYDVTVLTSKAVDYNTWQDEYHRNTEDINGVHVIRFSVEHPRISEKFNAINDKFLLGKLTREEEQDWVNEQGPYVPRLIEYLHENKNTYEVFIFFTYLYYQTTMGVPEVKDKAIVFPFAHPEPFMNMAVFDNVFLLPKGLIFETEEERKLVRNIYYNYKIPYFIGGAGVDLPSDVSAERFKIKYHIDNYIIYVGRIDMGKNCDELFDYFLKYKQQHPSNLKLVLLGKEMIKVPKNPDIVSLGFVSDQDKFDGISGSRFLVLPSKLESLSIVVLEAFSLGRAVLVNGKCSVLKEHCDESKAGLYYENECEFSKDMEILLEDEKRCNLMGIAGKEYVNRKYNWDIILNKISDMIEYVRCIGNNHD